MSNVKSEFELYEPMRLWLERYLKSKYKGCEIITEITCSTRLDRILDKYRLVNDNAVGIDIQIDVLGIVKLGKEFKLFFIEAKKRNLTLRDLGQLWAYCKLIDPEEAFLMTSASFGTLDKILNVLKREDLLDFGDGKYIKKMKVAIWNLDTNSPNIHTMFPKI